MVARIDVQSERFCRTLAQLFELAPEAPADISYDVVEGPTGFVVRRGRHLVFKGRDGDKALLALYGDLYERFIGAAGSLLLLNAGAATKGGRAIVLPGARESGKSTLTTLLAARGWSVISDDVGAIDVARLRIAPHPRHLLIRPVTFERNQGGRRGVHVLRILDAYGQVAFIAEPLHKVSCPSPIALIVFPSWSTDGRTTLLPLTRGQAAAALMEHSLNLRFLGPRGVSLAAELSRGVPAFRLATADPETALDKLEELHFVERLMA